MPSRVKVKKKTLKRAPVKRRKSVSSKGLKKQKGSLFKRGLRLIFNPLTIAVSALLFLGVFLAATYFWFEFSEKIDLLLSGEIFTRNAGIYSAPKTLKKGEKITAEELTDYLKSAGYIGKDQKADVSRSRFAAVSRSVEIEPGTKAFIDGKRSYRNIRVKFNKDRKSVASILDTDSKKELKKTLLEPQLLNSLAAEGDGRRKVIVFNDLPQYLVKAITVTEDRAFFEHHGVNFRGVARALWRRYEGDTGSPLDNQGGSSITQQLVKNLLLSPEKSYERKAKEAYMSVILETRLSKEDIFTLYANQIYLGQNAGVAIYGVGEAANIYFGKDVSALTLSESAFLAGIIRSPNRYNPYKNLKRVEKRRNQVLSSMLEANAINGREAGLAKSSELKLNKTPRRTNSHGMQYFAQYAVEQLPKVVSDPEALQHLRVYTTIDPDLQKVANKVVKKRLARLEKIFKKEKRGKLNAALIALKPKTGEIVAMIGGKNYLENQFNRATDAKRQPGSVFKPFVYASAINTAYQHHARTLTAASVFKDEKKVFTFNRDSYSPNNYGRFFSNKDITLRDALMKSKNVITVDLAMELNIGNVMTLAHKAGLPKVKRAYPSMALGTSEATPLEMATAYTVFANLGEKISPIAINRVTSGNGKTIVAPKGKKKTVLRSDVTYIMNDMMKDVINRGTAAKAKAWGFTNVSGKRGYAGKTGTSRDGWFVGFTPEIVCVVYVGFDDGSDLGLDGSKSAMPIWAEFMRDALKQHPEWNGDWAAPDTIRKAEIDIRNGSLIRELTNGEADSIKVQKEVLEKEAEEEDDDEWGDDESDSEAELEKLKQQYVKNVPPEFRRIELFISGTIPRTILLPTDDLLAVDEVKPTPSPTPFTTWEDAEEKQKDETSKSTERKRIVGKETITVMYCLASGKRAHSRCPNLESKTFSKGSEPKELCEIHIPPD